MKSLTCATVAVTIALAAVSRAQTQPPAPATADVVRELKELRRELVLQGIELQRLKAGALVRELRALETSKGTLEENARLLALHLEKVDQSAVGKPEHAEELQSARADLQASQGKVQAAQREIDEQTRAAEGQLAQEQQRLGELLQRLESLKNADPPGPDRKASAR